MASVKSGGNEGNLRIALTSRDFATNPNSKLASKPSLIQRSTFRTQRVSPNRPSKGDNIFTNTYNDNS